MKNIIERIAKVCHEANRAFCDSIGDHSQPSWEDAPQWQRNSAESGVRHHISKPHLTAEMSHELWYDLKKADGWVFGETKDPDNKIHPCMVQYSDLPVEQQSKDYIFRAIVHAMSSDI